MPVSRCRRACQSSTSSFGGGGLAMAVGKGGANVTRGLDGTPKLPYPQQGIEEEVRLPTATVTSKGQITIPKEVRDALGLESGHQVSFLLREDGVVEMYPKTVDLMSLYGFLRPSVRGVTLEDMEEAIRKGASGG